MRGWPVLALKSKIQAYELDILFVFWVPVVSHGVDPWLVLEKVFEEVGGWDQVRAGAAALAHSTNNCTMGICYPLNVHVPAHAPPILMCGVTAAIGNKLVVLDEDGKGARNV